MPFQKIKFDNGLRLILVPQPKSLSTTVMILVEAGSEYETKEINGLSHFLEHMCFKGTIKRPSQLAISTALDNLGAEYNAFTSREYTGYFAKVRNKNFEKSLEIVSDLYLHPLFNSEEIEKERGPIIEEINMYEDLPMQRVQELFLETVYGDQPAGWSVAGTKENIRRFQRDDFLKYRADHYVAEATIVVVAGGFSLKSAEEKVKEYFQEIKTGVKVSKVATKEEQNQPVFKILEKPSDQTHLVLGFRAFNIHDERRYALGVLANILGGGISSRLFQKIRSELGAAYYINASTDLYTDHGVFLVAAGVDHQKIEEVIKTILAELVKMREKSVTIEELKRAKEHMIGTFFLSLESSDELASFYGSQEIVGEELLTPQMVAKKIQAVTREDIQAVSQFIFQNNRLNLALIGPLKDKDFSSILKL